MCCYLEIFRALYELVWQAVKNGINKESFFTILGNTVVINIRNFQKCDILLNIMLNIILILKLSFQPLSTDVISILLDVVNVIDHETLVNENTDERQQFCSILKELENWFSETLMKERLEIDTLQDCNILKVRKVFYTRFIKVKTKLFYKQQKFNLLREESEGYAKLITELNQEVDETISPLYVLQVLLLYLIFI